MNNHHNLQLPGWTGHATLPAQRLLMGVVGMALLLVGVPAHAGESQTPWECSSYTGDAHTRCLQAFVEAQRDQIAALQGQMQAQQDTVTQLKDQIDRQATANADAQRRLVSPPAVVQVTPPYYAYPPVGLGLGFSFGSPWMYGSPYFYPPYIYGPRFYFGSHHRGHRW